MTEYTLILSVVAVVVFIDYQTMGTTVTALLTNVGAQTNRYRPGRNRRVFHAKMSAELNGSGRRNPR
jgi:hypothetical protein